MIDTTTRARIRREAEELEREWATDPRWRASSARTPVRTSSGSAARYAWSTRSPGSAPSDSGSSWHARVHRGARRHDGRPSRQMVKAGLKAIYLSGLAGGGRREPGRPDLPRSEPVPRELGARGRAADRTTRCMRADQIDVVRGQRDTDCCAPIVADAEAGFGGPLNAFELMRAMIEAGAAGVHFEDQLASEKKCGHLGGKVLGPHGAVRPDADRRRAWRPTCSASPRSWSRGPTRWPRR